MRSKLDARLFVGGCCGRGGGEEDAGETISPPLYVPVGVRLLSYFKVRLVSLLPKAGQATREKWCREAVDGALWSCG